MSTSSSGENQRHFVRRSRAVSLSVISPVIWSGRRRSTRLVVKLQYRSADIPLGLGQVVLRRRNSACWEHATTPFNQGGTEMLWAVLMPDLIATERTHRCKGAEQAWNQRTASMKPLHYATPASSAVAQHRSLVPPIGGVEVEQEYQTVAQLGDAQYRRDAIAGGRDARRRDTSARSRAAPPRDTVHQQSDTLRASVDD